MISTTHAPRHLCRSRRVFRSPLLSETRLHRRQRHDPSCPYSTYLKSGRHGGVTRRAGALVTAALMAAGTATACRTDALPTPRPLPAPTVPAGAGESPIQNLDAVHVMCDRGRAAAQAVRAGWSVDSTEASIQHVGQVSLDSGATDAISVLVSTWQAPGAPPRARVRRIALQTSDKRTSAWNRSFGHATGSTTSEPLIDRPQGEKNSGAHRARRATLTTHQHSHARQKANEGIPMVTPTRICARTFGALIVLYLSTVPSLAAGVSALSGASTEPSHCPIVWVGGQPVCDYLTGDDARASLRIHRP